MQADYLRIYFERGTGMAVVDTGQGTERIERPGIVLTGSFTGEHAPDGKGPPRWWLRGYACGVKVVGDTIVAWTMKSGEE